MNTSELVHPNHVQRQAVVYVRQSTPHQALANQESLQMQYGLGQRAVELGWMADDVRVVDSVVGRTGSTAKGRRGFQQLVADVSLGRVGIILAYTLKDNRAFCKYVCPVSVPLKLTSRFSVIKIGQAEGVCNDCNACEKMCPMDVRISDYILNNQRVLSTECSLCQTCITVCTQNAIKVSFGFDLGGKDLLRKRMPKTSQVIKM